MSILWDIGKPATSMDVMEQSLYKRRSQELEPASFATVATTLRRLPDKGVITMQKNMQGTPVYSPTVAREEMAARILNNVSPKRCSDSPCTDCCQGCSERSRLAEGR